MARLQFLCALIAISLTCETCARSEQPESSQLCENYNTILSLSRGPQRAGCQYALWRTAFLGPTIPFGSPNITDVEFRVRLGSESNSFHALHGAFFCCDTVGKEGEQLDEVNVLGCERVSMSRNPEIPRNSPITEYVFRRHNLLASCGPFDLEPTFIVVARGPYTISSRLLSESPSDNARLIVDGAAVERTIEPGTRHFYRVSVPAGKHSIRALLRVERAPFRADVRVEGRWGHPIGGTPLTHVMQASPSAEVLRDCVEVVRPPADDLYFTVQAPMFADRGHYSLQIVSNVGESSCARPGDNGPI